MAVILILFGIGCFAASLDDFESWRQYDSATGVEDLLKNGWLEGNPPYFMPTVNFQSGPRRSSDGKDTGKEVVSESTRSAS